MAARFKLFTVTIILCLVCACSTTPPIVVHDEYGEMRADNEMFRKDASECALQANQGVQGTNLTQNSHKSETVFSGLQFISFFTDHASCIETKGWRIRK